MITSTLNDKSTNFIDAIINSIPSYDSLWFLKQINTFDPGFFNDIEKYSFKELAYLVLEKLNILEGLNQNTDFTDILKKSIDEAFNFPIKIETLDYNLHILECFHGPTLTFKDFGAGFMASFLNNYLENLNNSIKYTILVATSGDTGSAIASGFYKKSNIKVIILYPVNKISKMQELQITTYGENVTAFGVNGSFDDCQTLVKKTLTDNEFSNMTNIKFISANSINLARLLPQCLYYFYSYGLLKKKMGLKEFNPIYSVPCGNCGNLVGGIIAKKMGLPIKKFIVGQNDNQTFHQYLETGIYKAKDTIKTISNAMDVGNPSNFKRIEYIYNQGNEIDTLQAIRNDIYSYYITEKKTIDTILYIKEKFDYIIDPHTSVAGASILEFSSNNLIGTENNQYIIVSTAHPSKFDNILHKIGINIDIHPNLLKIQHKFQEKMFIKNNYQLFKKILDINNYKNIFLIGMPGSGKTTISNFLNNKYSIIEKVELDNEIEKKKMMPLMKILNTISEQEFLKLEEETIFSSIKHNGNSNNKIRIISSGGSAIYCSDGMKYIKKYSIVIYLKIDNQTILERTNNLSNRGIIFNGKTHQEFFEERSKLYHEWCDIEIDCNNYTVSELGNLIYQKFIKI